MRMSVLPRTTASLREGLGSAKPGTYACRSTRRVLDTLGRRCQGPRNLSRRCRHGLQGVVEMVNGYGVPAKASRTRVTSVMLIR